MFNYKENEMRLVMEPVLWDELGLDSPERYELALCCFYLGKGIEETRDVLSRRQDDREAEFIVSTALFCGLSDKDSIRKGT